MTAALQLRERPGRLRLALAAYGLAVAIVGTAAWVVAFPDSSVVLQGGRQARISGSVAVLDHGGPPLVVADGGAYLAASQGDDQGIYLILGELGHLTGTRNAINLFKDFTAGAMGVLVALAPLGAYLLLDSLLLAILAPLALLASFPFLTNRDVYFANAWIVLLGLPIAYLALERPWSRQRALSLLALAALASSASNGIRAHSGTGVAVALVAVAFLRERSWLPRLAAVSLVAACYLVVSPLAISAIQRHAFATAHLSPDAQGYSHTLWHPAYLGLGYLPNAWGIEWNDRVGEETAKRIDPSVVYLSPHYEQILRHQYFAIVEHHPFWVARMYAVKTAALIWETIKHGGVLVLLLPAALFLGRRQDLLRRRLLLLVPSMVIASIPPLLAVPMEYDSGLTACLDLAGALALGSIVGTRLVGPRRRAVLVTAILFVVILASAITTQVFAGQVARQLSG